jgi:glycerol-3-phosphate dehydrogenase
VAFSWLFEGDDEAYIDRFPDHVQKRQASPATSSGVATALEEEPALARDLIAAYAVEDASIDPFKLSLENMSDARSRGARYLRYMKVNHFEVQQGRIAASHLTNQRTGEQFQIRARQVVNAGGAWAGIIAALAGIQIDMLYSKGSLLVTHDRLTQKVINRLRPPADADIIVPGGTVSIVGTSSVRVASPDRIRPTVREVDHIVAETARMVPGLETTRYVRTYTGVRPLLAASDTADGRSVSRGFALMDHCDQGVDNLLTITGGKLTTFRLMAEKAADLICERLGVTATCSTHAIPLPEADGADWTEPGRAPRLWLQQQDPDDLLLCECEMVPQKAVDSIVQTALKNRISPDLRTIGLRSRIGKGACQGTFCSTRVLAYLHELGVLAEDQGLYQLPEFLDERWRGQRCIFWDGQLIQAELQEALHCGLFSLELNTPRAATTTQESEESHEEG